MDTQTYRYKVNAVFIVHSNEKKALNEATTSTEVNTHRQNIIIKYHVLTIYRHPV